MQSGRSSTSSAAVSPSATAPEYPSSAGTIVKLGVGAFGLAWSLTTTAAYLPPVLGEYTGSTSLIGAVLAAEGVFALTLPLVIGPWSDTFHTPLGRRRPFMLVAVGPIGFCLALMAFMPNLWTTALLVFAFFFAYYVYEPPYRGLYPDLLPEHVYGRAQGVQHVFRGIALGGASSSAAFSSTSGSRHRSSSPRGSSPPRVSCPSSSSGRTAGAAGCSRVSAPTCGTPGAFCAATRTWGGSCSRTRPGRGRSPERGRSSFSTSPSDSASRSRRRRSARRVAAGYVIAALVSGPIGDRFGLARVITWCSLVYGLALLGGGLATQWHAWYLAIIFVVALFAGSVMTLRGGCSSS